MKELDKAVDNFKYWVETNEENGVCTMPKFICNDLLEAYKKHKQQLKEKQPKKGRWIENDDENFQCSECGNESFLTFDDVFVYGMQLQKFCSNCGADMRKDGEQK